MKLQAVIGGDKIDDLEFRFFFFYKAVELGCERFFSFIRNSEGLRYIKTFLAFCTADFWTDGSENINLQKKMNAI